MSPVPNAVSVVLGELKMASAHRDELYDALWGILREAKRKDISHDGQSVTIRIGKAHYQKARRALLKYKLNYEEESR